MDEKMKININQIFGIDPLMKFKRRDRNIKGKRLSKSN